MENFASGNGQQKACISLSVIFMKFLLHPATYHVSNNLEEQKNNRKRKIQFSIFNVSIFNLNYFAFILGWSEEGEDVCCSSGPP